MKIHYVLEGCIDHFKNILFLLKGAPQKRFLTQNGPFELKFSGMSDAGEIRLWLKFQPDWSY